MSRTLLAVALATTAVVVPAVATAGSVSAARSATSDPPPEVVTITPDAWLTLGNHDNTGTGPRTCGIKDIPGNSCADEILDDPAQFPPDLSSQLHWGSASSTSDPRRPGIGVRSGPSTEVTLGQPFEVLTFGVFDRPHNGDAPTSRAIRVVLTIQPPGEEPIEFSLDDPESPLGNFGKRDPWQLDLLQTDNNQPCDPAIQVTDIPCDDLFGLRYYQGGRPVAVEKVVGDVTWRFELLGYDDPLTGILSPRLVVQEGTEVRVPVLGVLTREGPDVPPDPLAACEPDASLPDGYAVVRGTAGANLLIGSNGPDLFLGGGGNDLILDFGGDDIICAGEGNDIVSAGRGDDQIDGGPGEDYLFGGGGSDRGLDPDPRTTRVGIELTT